MPPVPELHTDPLPRLLEQALDQPAVTPGLQFWPEKELSERLGVTRWRLRKAMDDLVQRGLLRRQQGSGTFVCRKPGQHPPDSPLPIDLAQLFLSVPPQPSTPDSRPTTTWTVGFWQDLNTPQATEATERWTDAFDTVARARGIALQFHCPVPKRGAPLDPASLPRQLADHPCDGYLMDAAWVEQLLPLADRLPPLLLIGRSPLSHNPWPILSRPAGWIAEQAICRLAEQYDRIGMIGMTGTVASATDRIQRELRDAYDAGLHKAGRPLAEPLIGFTRGGIAQSSVEAFTTTRQLLDRPNPPDALFVSDDHLLYGVLEVIHQSGRRPGHDFGLITSCIHGASLPGPYRWSRYESHYDYVAEQALDLLMRAIRKQPLPTDHLQIAPTWVAGETHRRHA